MRIAIMAAALGVVLGVPGVAPETMVPAAQAQSQAQVDALQAEILAAPDQATIDAIIARETAAGNFNALAEGLAGASEARAATDVQGAAALVQLAITVADSAGDDAQIIVGLAASAVASTASSLGLTAEASAIETAANNSADPDVGTAYVVAGGQNAQPIVTTDTGSGTTPTTPTTTTTTGDDTTTTTGDDTTTTTGDDTTTPTPDTGAVTPPPPPPPSDPVVPVVPEPNPVQVVDPIVVVEPPTVDDVGSPT